MCTRKVSSTLAAAVLVAVVCFAWPLRAIGQGYFGQIKVSPTDSINLGDRHSPVAEHGVKVCDYWGKDFRTESDGTWRVQHVRGPIVTKHPNRQASVITVPENYDTSPGTLARLNGEVPMTWLKYRDNSDGSILHFKVLGDVPLGGVVMIGEWEDRSGRRGLITCAVYQKEARRILLWFTYPDAPDYGSAVLQETAQGLNGYYAYGGRTGGWTLTAFQK